MKTTKSLFWIAAAAAVAGYAAFAVSAYATQTASNHVGNVVTHGSASNTNETLRNEAPVSPEVQELMNETSAWDKAGKVAMHEGNYVEAEADYRKSIAALFCNGDAYDGLAESLAAQGRDDEALQTYEQIIYPAANWSTSAGSTARTLLPYALLLCKKGQWQQAAAAYNNAIPHIPHVSPKMMPAPTVSIDISHLDPQLLQSALHLALGIYTNIQPDEYGWHHDKALVEYTKALHLEPNWDVANFYYAYGLHRLGRRAEAEAAFQKAADLSNGDVRAKAQLAVRRW